MITLHYKPTYIFSSLDIFDYADTEPIIYEAYARQSPNWAMLCRDWLKDESEDVERALEIVGMAIVSVEQGGEKFQLHGIEGAKALRDAVEAENPGYGDVFVKHLALGHYALHFRRLDERLGNSPNGLEPSSGGDNLDK